MQIKNYKLKKIGKVGIGTQEKNSTKYIAIRKVF